MKLLIQKQGICFFGKAKELTHIFVDFPPETTLLQFINMHLH